MAASLGGHFERIDAIDVLGESRPLFALLSQELAEQDLALLPPEVLVEPGLSCILTTRAAAARRRAALERAGAQVVDVRQRRGRVDLRAAWRVLALRGVNDLLVEGGGGLAAALLREGLIDRIHLYVAPLLIGADGHAVLESLDVDVLSDAPRARNARVRRVGADWCFTWDPEND